MSLFAVEGIVPAGLICPSCPETETGAPVPKLSCCFPASFLLSPAVGGQLRHSCLQCLGNELAAGEQGTRWTEEDRALIQEWLRAISGVDKFSNLLEASVSPDAEVMEVKVMTLTGESKLFRLEPAMQVHDLKKAVHRAFGVDPTKQKLICGGKELDKKLCALFAPAQKHMPHL
jgi:hypothetical protein